MIDGTGAAPVPDAIVVLEGRRIQAIGPRRAVRVPVNAVVIDGRGLFVLPGLVDVNVHVSNTKEAAGALQYGVTTIRDSFNPKLARSLAIRDSLRAGYVLGPRMLVAGDIIGWGPGATKPDGDELTSLGVDSLRIQIRRYLDKGVDFLKYGATSHGSGKVLFSSQAQRAIVEEVHKRGLVVETHATGITGLRTAVLAGVDLVQHAEISGLTEEDARHGQLWPDDLVQLLVERRVICALHPTSNDASGEWARARLINRQRLIRGGCTIAVTTDWKPGRLTLQAIERLVEEGMAPMDALVAATRNGALACKMLDQFGTVTPGKLADLVVLRANPLQDIKNIEQMAMVFTEGKRVDISPLPAVTSKSATEEHFKPRHSGAAP